MCTVQFVCHLHGNLGQFCILLKKMEDCSLISNFNYEYMTHHNREKDAQLSGTKKEEYELKRNTHNFIKYR